MIIEAVVPNPDGACRVVGRLRLAQLWKDLDYQPDPIEKSSSAGRPFQRRTADKPLSRPLTYWAPLAVLLLRLDQLSRQRAARERTRKGDAVMTIQPHPLARLGPLYHDYSLFGVSNEQHPGPYRLNQACKAPILLAYIQWAIAKCRASVHSPVRFVELFCADGYYALAARHLGATHAAGIDNDREGHLYRALPIAQALNIDHVDFFHGEVDHIDTLEPVEIVANVGGLYHVANPREVLVKSHQLAKRFLIVQTVVTLAEQGADYFRQPAPGWTWGCRYSRASFEALIDELGYRVVDSHFNELEGNSRLEDRGSAYYLIQTNSG